MVFIDVSDTKPAHPMRGGTGLSMQTHLSKIKSVKILVCMSAVCVSDMNVNVMYESMLY